MEEVEVVENVRETASVWRLALAWDVSEREPVAARFAMLGLPLPTPHLLPRPFSISDAYDGVCEFLYKPVGRVTGAMTGLVAGQRVRIFGLCGNGFPAPEAGHRAVLVAGGIGNAPFAYHARELISLGVPAAEIVLFLAGRGREDVWVQPRVREWGVTVVEASEDGSCGQKGLVTDALRERLPDLGPCELYVCGPTPMLRAVADLARAADCRAHLAIEERMACGYGVCNACVVEAEQPGRAAGEGDYLKACVDGPVFECRSIRL